MENDINRQSLRNLDIREEANLEQPEFRAITEEEKKKVTSDMELWFVSDRLVCPSHAATELTRY